MKIIVIFGLDTKPEEITPEYICNELRRLIHVTINESDLNNIYSLGRKERAPVKVVFVSYLKKSAVLKNAKNLKGAHISVANDLTLIQREKHTILRKYLILAKANNHINCYIRRNKLFVDEKKFPIAQDQLDRLISVTYLHKTQNKKLGTKVIECFEMYKKPNILGSNQKQKNKKKFC